MREQEREHLLRALSINPKNDAERLHLGSPTLLYSILQSQSQHTSTCPAQRRLGAPSCPNRKTGPPEQSAFSPAAQPASTGHMASSSSHAGCMNRFPSPDATASNQVPSDAPRSHLRSYTRYALDQECQTVPSSSSACQAGPSRLLHHQQHSQSRCINGTLGLTLPAPVSTAASCLLDGRTSAARLLAVASPATTSAQMFLTTPASLPSATNVFMSSREVGDAQPIKRISPLSSSFDKAQEWFDSRRWSKEEVDNFLYGELHPSLLPHAAGHLTDFDSCSIAMLAISLQTIARS